MKSSDIAKLVVSLIMWISLGIISITAIEHGADPNALSIVPLILGLLGMAMIWAPELFKSETPVQQQDPSEKAKHGSRREEQLAFLMEMMDDDELADFKNRLKHRLLDDVAYPDGELPYSSETLESLLDGEETGKRCR